METDDSFVGNSNDVFYRDASNGHYFSYLMQTGGQTNLSLRLKYWGVGEWKSHEFDIFVDDVLVTSVNNTGKYRISEFKYETYPVPEEALKGKKQVRVKFVAKPHRQIGEIYEVRLDQIVSASKCDARIFTPISIRITPPSSSGFKRWEALLPKRAPT